MGKGRFRPTTKDSRCIVHQVFIVERLNYEQCEVDPPYQVTRQRLRTTARESNDFQRTITIDSPVANRSNTELLTVFSG